MNLTVNIIGTGKLGKTIGRLITQNKLADIQGVVNRQLEHSIQGIQFIQAGVAYPNILALPHASLTFITTPDAAIEDTCLELSLNKNIKPNDIIIHCSGVLTSDSLLPMKQLGCTIASIHPMHSFAEPRLSIQQYAGTFCSIEGDLDAISVLTKLLTAFGSIVYPIHKDKKLMVHVAGVFASNYLVTLSQQALSCLTDAGVEKHMAMNIILNIMQGTLFNLEKTQSPEDTLTGPIQRGDIITIEKHLRALLTTEQKKIYSLLGTATLALTNHTQDKLDELSKALLSTQVQR